MRYLGFCGVVGDTVFNPGGWNNVVAGGEHKIEIERETRIEAQAKFDAFAPEVKQYVAIWWHVADLETGAIVAEGGFRSETRQVSSPKHWLVRA